MKIYALVGSSGTGKSYRAMEVANNYNIEMMIDDGLIIWGTKVVAGSSAKKEKTKIAAVKRALFSDKSHIEDTKAAIIKYNPNSILILGTSDKMVKRVQETLKLPEIEETIYIGDVSSIEEIEMARNIRIKEGKHVIPVPALEIKKYFSGYFLDPLKIFRKNSHSKRTEFQEKTVVRPTFSYLGNYTIADTVVSSVVNHIASGVDGIYRVGRINIITNPNGLIIELDVYIVYGLVIPILLKNVQRDITTKLEFMTGQNILGVNIYVKGLWVKKDEN
jgi:uncharacterized alkaline shock family protein YloU/adenylate kinase family enzyme